MNKMKIEDLIIKWKNDGGKIASFYQDLIRKEGISPKALGERSEDKDFRFYEELFSNISLPNKLSILDIGSGQGDIIDFIGKKYPDSSIEDYLGIDLVPEYVEYTQRKYPQYRFENANFIDPNFYPEKSFDIVVAMGTLVSRVSYYDEYIEYFLEKMLEYSDK